MLKENGRAKITTRRNKILEILQKEKKYILRN